MCLGAPGNTHILSEQLQLAVNEAFANIVKHAYGKQSGEIIIRAQYLKDRIVFELCDQGKSFDPQLVEEPSLSGDRSSGFGVFLISKIADRVVYMKKQSESAWNHIRIFKNYHYEDSHMNFSHQLTADSLLVKLEGKYLDAQDVKNFKEAVFQLVDSTDTSQVVFDLSTLEFIDSSGLGGFLSILRQLNTQNGDLKLSHMSNSIRAMFELVRMHKLFEIYDTSDLALESFKPQVS